MCDVLASQSAAQALSLADVLIVLIDNTKNITRKQMTVTKQELDCFLFINVGVLPACMPVLQVQTVPAEA